MAGPPARPSPISSSRRRPTRPRRRPATLPSLLGGITFPTRSAATACAAPTRSWGGLSSSSARPGGRRHRGSTAVRWAKTVTVVGAHAEGEIGRVIVGGVLPPPGKTMFERMKYLETQGDDLRQMLLFDPRGGVTVSMNLV